MGCDQEVISSQGYRNAIHRARLADDPSGHALVARQVQQCCSCCRGRVLPVGYKLQQSAQKVGPLGHLHSMRCEALPKLLQDGPQNFENFLLCLSSYSVLGHALGFWSCRQLHSLWHVLHEVVAAEIGKAASLSLPAGLPSPPCPR